VRDRWLLLRKRAGMPEDLRIHDLRHTASTSWPWLACPRQCA
jgi:integrase